VAVLGFIYLMIKSLVAYWVIMWVRLTLPRVRIDHLLDFNWKFLVPLSLANLMMVAFLWKVIPDTDQITNFREALRPTLILLAANILMIVGVAALLHGRWRRERMRIEGRRGEAYSEHTVTG
jgi:formate hydrogenlyase subunit 4